MQHHQTTSAELPASPASPEDDGGVRLKLTPAVLEQARLRRIPGFQKPRTLSRIQASREKQELERKNGAEEDAATAAAAKLNGKPSAGKRASLSQQWMEVTQGESADGVPVTVHGAPRAGPGSTAKPAASASKLSTFHAAATITPFAKIPAPPSHPPPATPPDARVPTTADERPDVPGGDRADGREAFAPGSATVADFDSDIPPPPGVPAPPPPPPPPPPLPPLMTENGVRSAWPRPGSSLSSGSMEETCGSSSRRSSSSSSSMPVFNMQSPGPNDALLQELKAGRVLRPTSKSKAVTTVFSGRGQTSLNDNAHKTETHDAPQRVDGAGAQAGGVTTNTNAVNGTGKATPCDGHVANGGTAGTKPTANGVPRSYSSSYGPASPTAAGGLGTGSTAGKSSTASFFGGATANSAAGKSVTRFSFGGPTVNSYAGKSATASSFGGATANSASDKSGMRNSFGGSTENSAAGKSVTANSFGGATTNSASGKSATRNSFGGSTANSAAGKSATASSFNGPTANSATGKSTTATSFGGATSISTASKFTISSAGTATTTRAGPNSGGDVTDGGGGGSRDASGLRMNLNPAGGGGWVVTPGGGGRGATTITGAAGGSNVASGRVLGTNAAGPAGGGASFKIRSANGIEFGGKGGAPTGGGGGAVGAGMNGQIRPVVTLPGEGKGAAPIGGGGGGDARSGKALGAGARGSVKSAEMNGQVRSAVVAPPQMPSATGNTLPTWKLEMIQRKKSKKVEK
ncbi:uncharacterized protein LOC144942874 [Lampetra fluviatilis]